MYVLIVSDTVFHFLFNRRFLWKRFLTLKKSSLAVLISIVRTILFYNIYLTVIFYSYLEMFLFYIIVEYNRTTCVNCWFCRKIIFRHYAIFPHLPLAFKKFIIDRRSYQFYILLIIIKSKFIIFNLWNLFYTIKASSAFFIPFPK